jgi:membrane-associated phospholipid phosphatase
VFLGSTPVLLFSAAEFGVLSLDLPTRNAVDEGVRDLVLAATDEETRATAREVSNVFPQAYLCLAALASAWLVFAASDGEGSRPYATRTRVGVAWATVGLAGVAVDLAKNLFGRVRPQLGLSSFAFPSGHTCAACVLSGVFLFLLLDPLLASKTSRDAPGTEPGTVAAKKTDLTTAVLNVGADARVRAFLWFLATSVTACGRVEGNRHWVSDTMGGAAMGTFFLSAALLAVGAAEARAARKGKEPST